LEKLGFPWILSSEMSLFNGLRGIFGGQNFCAALSFEDVPRDDGRAESPGSEVQESSSHDPSADFLFSQGIVARSFAISVSLKAEAA